MVTDEEFTDFVEYCNKRGLISLQPVTAKRLRVMDSDSKIISVQPVTVERLRVMDSDSKIIEAEGISYNDALDNFNIALQASLRRKIDALCEELKELEEMGI